MTYPCRSEVSSSITMADSVENPPHMPMPTPRLVSWRTLLRIHDACDIYVVSAA